MRLGMMQPYFFPYLGYFGLISATDTWVVFDTAQYIRRGWVNRNRVLSRGAAGWSWLRVPVVYAPRETAIRGMRISDPHLLPMTAGRCLDEYRVRRAPYYEETAALVDECLSHPGAWLVDLLVRCLQATCEHLLIPFDAALYSELEIPDPPAARPGDWALETASYLGASEYINPPGGESLFDMAEFQRRGIRLTILEHTLPPYPRGDVPFLPGLSIIDVLMWNGRVETRKLIDQFHLFPAGRDLVASEGAVRVRDSA